MGRINLRFPWIDSNHRSSVTLSELLAQVPYGGNDGPGTQFHHDDGCAVRVDEFFESLPLPVGPVTDLGPVAEHQNIRSRHGPAPDTAGNAFGTHGIRVHGNLFPVLPDGPGAGYGAL